MFINDDDMIPVIRRLDDLKKIDDESRRIRREDWIVAVIGSTAAIALIFTLAAILNQ